MIRFQCNGCQGVYEIVQADGSSYFHVCPPEWWIVAELPGGPKVERPLSTFREITLVPDAATRDRLVEGGAAPETLAIEIRREARERPQHRDENTAYRTGPNGEERVIVSEGAGRTPHPDPPGQKRRGIHAL